VGILITGCGIFLDVSLRAVISGAQFYFSKTVLILIDRYQIEII